MMCLPLLPGDGPTRLTVLFRSHSRTHDHMDWITEQHLRLALLIVYLAILAHHAWKGKQQTHSMEDFLTGGRRMGGILIGLSFYATFMSTNTFIGAAGKSWEVGLVWCWGGLVLTGLCCLSWFLVAPRFVPLTREYRSLTLADFLGFHYKSPRIRRLSAAITAFASLIYLVAIYQGASLALASFLGIPYGWCALIVFLVVTSYTLVGGFSSVVLTDALQGILMVIGAVGMPLAIIVQAGGVEAAWAKLYERDPVLVSWEGNFSIWSSLGVATALGVKFLVEPRLLSRFYGLRDARAVRQASFVAPLLIGISYLTLLPIGALAHAVIPFESVQSTDEVVPHLLGTINVLGPVLSVVFLLVLVSAAMSSIDSVLLVAASTIDRDLLGNETEAASALNRMRGWVIAVSLATVLIAVSPLTDDIVTLTAFSGSLYGACFFAPLVLGLYRTRRNGRAALLSMSCGAVTVIGWFVARQMKLVDSHEVWIGMAIGITTLFLFEVILREPVPTLLDGISDGE